MTTTPSSSGYLHEMPASSLIDQLAIPMLAVRLDGVVFYSNPAFATMLGHHPDTVRLVGQRLPELLAGHSAAAAADFVTALRTAGTMVVDWTHTDGFLVRCLVSPTPFVRATDEILLIGVTDITELTWSVNTDRC